MNETRYPLYWPEGWKRCVNRERARFGRRERQYGERRPDGSRSEWTESKQVTVVDGIGRVLSQLRSMGVREGDSIISTNVEVRLDGLPYSSRSEPRDPGVAIYWKDSKQRKKCMAVDRYDRVADNIAAIAATLDAMRAIERHGGAEILERTFLGFAALPQATGRNWREILELAGDKITAQVVEDRYRSLARVRHPDKGGTPEQFHELTAARDAALREVG